MPVTASELRQDIYRLLDEVLDTGVPLEIERKGRLLRIVPVDGRSKLARCSANPDYITGDPEDLVHSDWSEEWSP
jgi:prevent-host-death family protein